MRFTDRVADYRRFRPGYPSAVGSFLRKELPPREGWIIADIGSGTGISSRFLASTLKCPVCAVEPNPAMRTAAESDSRNDPFFRSIDGCAEATGLPSRSVNLVCAFQAFHWFDLAPARKECQRILRKNGWVIIAWNDRMSDEHGFSAGYERLLQSLPQYKTSTHRRIIKDNFQRYFGTSRIKVFSTPNFQSLDWKGLMGRFFSTSYSPKRGSAEYSQVRRELKVLFDKFSVRSRISFKYRTILYLARFR